MLDSITARYFRKHKDSTINFSSGLNIIKAGNEFGKTTLLEALGYNCFGTGALRQPLKEVVSDPKWATWLDKKPSITKLFTESRWNLGGTTYRVTRTSKGAEVYVNDSDKPKVTGQKEVTLYMENLFGIPAGKASSLLIAEQGDVRGILSKGAADTSKFIEDLANFSEIDELVTKVQLALSTGSSQSEKDRLELAEQNLGELKVVAPVDEEFYMLKNDELQIDKVTCERAVSELNKSITSQEQTVLENTTNKTLRQKYEMDISSAQIKIADLGEEPKKLELIVDFEAYERLMDKTEHNSEIILKSIEDRKIYAEFIKLPTCEDEWDEPYQSLILELNSAEKELADEKLKLGSLQQALAVKKAEKINGDTCQTCGNIPDPEKTEEHNKKVNHNIVLLNNRISGKQNKISDVESFISILKAIKSVGDSIVDFSDLYPDNCLLGPNVKVPRDIKFKGWDSKPVELIDELQYLTGEIEKFDALKLQLEENQTLTDQYTLDSATFIANKKSAEEALALVPKDKDVVDTSKLEAEIIVLNAKVLKAETKIANLITEQNEKRTKFEVYEQSKSILGAEVTAAKKSLETKDLANLLLKDIRTARNKVTNNIWSTVLKVVSNYFTNMRGELSQVTRGEKEFLVNGKSTKGLSGSTLDILGLSFRIAQMELFLPGCPTLFLDEPFAGCDEARAASCLGLVSSAIDKQTVIVLHNEITESLCCGNFIKLGE